MRESDLVDAFIPLVKDLSSDSSQHVRSALASVIMGMAPVFFDVGFFDDKMGALCMQWLQDKVHSICDAAANNLKRLAEEFGPEWAMQHLVPQVVDMITNLHYLHQMTILRAGISPCPCHGLRDYMF